MVTFPGTSVLPVTVNVALRSEDVVFARYVTVIMSLPFPLVLSMMHQG